MTQIFYCIIHIKSAAGDAPVGLKLTATTAADAMRQVDALEAGFRFATAGQSDVEMLALTAKPTRKTEYRTLEEFK